MEIRNNHNILIELDYNSLKNLLSKNFNKKVTWIDTENIRDGIIIECEA